MKQKILLTGAFGNVGQNTLKQLLTREYEVTCFDIKNSPNEKSRKKLLKNWQFKTIWGDILNINDLNNVVKGMDCIIHLAAIIPPLSEKKPELAYKVNVEGTQNLINAVKALPNKPRIIMASSIGIYGTTMHLKPPVKADTPLNPSNHYSHTKVECEKILIESELPWMILRLGAVSVEKIPLKFDTLLFEIPLDQRIEFVSSIDCGIAFANAVMIDKIKKIYLIGGGEDCQLLEREFIRGFFNALGLTMLPDKAFKIPKKKEDWFYTDWMDTKESQEILNFQTENFQQYVEKLKRKFRLRRLGLKIISPIVKLILLRKSPYNKTSNDTI
ncbi:MAG: NAD(P)-dependent oxidoreductase [Candidatus Lokiarchaeota archaeon]|nr:NAD(P)-dependent oxidoreductase [Candidatus Lokiarchaeota archaeon]